MKFWNSEYYFEQPWEKVAQAAWRKYPNPLNPSVTAIDVLERNVENGILHTLRLVTSHWGLPGFVSRLVGHPTFMYATERSKCDRKNKVMILHTRNITFCKYVSVDEILWYEPCPISPLTRTKLRQEATIVVDGVPLSSYLESFLANSISSNAQKGRQGMELVLKKINEELNELSATAVKNTDEFISTTKHSIEEITESAKKTTKKSLDDLEKSLQNSITSKKPATSTAQP